VGNRVTDGLKSPPAIPQGTGAWENEGGALSPGNPSALPDGVIAIPVTHYRVGPYRYTNLDDAMAQYRRQWAK
tara:strand:- start:358 stop:576 length:219 start_codon:yes stop_codon:yes gene_type:complete